MEHFSGLSENSGNCFQASSFASGNSAGSDCMKHTAFLRNLLLSTTSIDSTDGKKPMNICKNNICWWL